MSQEDVELVRRGFDAFNQRDRSAWLALAHCWRISMSSYPADWPENAMVRGSEAVWDFAVRSNEPSELASPMGAIKVIRAAENDVVAAHVGRRVRGKASGIEAEFGYWAVLTFSNGKLLRSELFTDRAQALEAAGLQE